MKLLMNGTLSFFNTSLQRQRQPSRPKKRKISQKIRSAEQEKRVPQHPLPFT